MLEERQIRNNYIAKNLKAIKEKLKKSSNLELFNSVLDYASDNNNLSLLIWILENAKNIPDTILDRIVNEVCKSRDYEIICKTAKLIKDSLSKKVLMEKLTEAVIDIGDIDKMMKFALYEEDVPIDRAIDAVVNSCDIDKLRGDKEFDKINEFVGRIYHFDINLEERKKKCSKTKLAIMLIKIGDPSLIESYALSVSDAPISPLADAIIRIGDPRAIVRFACFVKGAPVADLGKAFIESGYKASEFRMHLAYAYEFAKHVPHLTHELARLIIANKDKVQDKKYYATHVINFARDIEGAPIRRLAQVIMEMNDLEYLISFAKSVPGAPIDEMLGLLLKSKSRTDDIIRFAKEVKRVDINKILDHFTYLDVERLYDLACNAPNAPIERIAKMAIQSFKLSQKQGFGDIGYLKELCQFIALDNAPVEFLINEIISISKKPEIIIEVAKYAPKAYKEQLADLIINLGDFKQICTFANEVPGAPIYKLVHAVIAMQNAELINSFALNVKVSYPVSVLYRAIRQTRNKKETDFFEQNILPKYDLTKEEAIVLYREEENSLEERYLALTLRKDIASFMFLESTDFCKGFINYLYNHISENNNEAILRVYYEFLSNPNGAIEEEAILLDEEYSNYIDSIRESADSKRKRLSIYSVMSNPN